MMAGMVEETAEQKLRRHEDALAACMAEITRLREENAKLRSEKSDALSVLREIYSDPDASQAHRIKAAGLALAHETPKLQPVPAPLELTAEPIVPLAELVEKRRARQAALEGTIEIVSDPSTPHRQRVNLLTEPNGSGSDDDCD